jgi:hypothetical protein
LRKRHSDTGERGRRTTSWLDFTRTPGIKEDIYSYILL